MLFISLPAGLTAKSYVASGAGLGRGLGTAGYGGLTRKDTPEIETAAGRATAGRVVPIAIPTSHPVPYRSGFVFERVTAGQARAGCGPQNG
ncbi:hypothetical protein F2Q70_00015561 [Brassica cretica]|uniref:Uncharacterized protein n=1 Tax=Brassica cretica TaxID=69181 RepID=A0A8S9I4P7_BRACR|nr:hypothetical protein F2Q70_00015561 [Brassica cretica]